MKLLTTVNSNDSAVVGAVMVAGGVYVNAIGLVNVGVVWLCVMDAPPHCVLNMADGNANEPTRVCAVSLVKALPNRPYI